MKPNKPIIFFALAGALLASCAENPSSSSSMGNASSSAGESAIATVTDLVGRKVEIKPGSYKKVVCIGAGALRLYTYVAPVEKLGGVEDIDNESLTNRPKMFDGTARPYLLAHGEAFKSLPSCGVGGPKAQTAEAEKILSCAPDLIVSEYEDADKANALQAQTKVPVLTVKYGAKGVFDEHIKTSLRLIGKAMGEEKKAESLVSYIDEQKAEISRLTENLSSSKKVYLGGLGNWGTTNHLMTAQNYEPFNVAHIDNVVTGLVKDGIQAIDAEKLISWGGQIDAMILDAAAIKNIRLDDATTKKTLESVKAWKEGEVYLQMPYNVYYTNIEIALANTWYGAKVVYPEAFKDLDMTKKTNEITNAFLGMELAEKIFACHGSFGGYQKIDPATFFAKGA